MPKKRKGKPAEILERQRAEQWSSAGLERDRREREHNELASKLTASEVDQLSRAIANVEFKKSARETFIAVAKKYKVSSGDLEQALAIRFGNRRRISDI